MPDRRENTYYIHLEALNTLLILLGCQMYTAKPAHELPVYRRVLKYIDVLVMAVGQT